MKGVYIFLAQGFEDIEALAVGDALRRAGIGVNYVGVADEPFVVSSHGVTIGVETFLSEFEESEWSKGGAHDFLIFPGGMPGTRNEASCKRLIALMNAHYEGGGSLAAICAAPGLILSQLKALPQGLNFTCFDGFEKALTDRGAVFQPRSAVRDGRIITGRSAGYAVHFGLEIVRAIKGDEVCEQVRNSMLLPIDDTQ